MQHSVHRIFGAIYSVVGFVLRIAAILIGMGLTFAVGLTLLVVLIYVVRAHTVYADISARYRLEVAVEIDGRKYLGSSVYQIDYSPQDWLFDLSERESPEILAKVRGEALEIDLGDRGLLMVLLSYNDIQSIAGPLRGMHEPLDLPNFIFASLLGHHGFGEYNSVKYEEIETLTKPSDVAIVKKELLLPILFVPDRNRIESMRFLSPNSTGADSFSSVFGGSSDVLYERISATTDPVTRSDFRDLPFIKNFLSNSIKIAGVYVDDVLHPRDEDVILDQFGNYKLALTMRNFEEDLYDRQYLYSRK